MEPGDRKGPFQVNAVGGRWYPLDPRPEDFEIEVIAHHLGNICRYGGAPRDFYSVAEHSVLVSFYVPPAFARHGLLHDAAEAVVGDTIKPIKLLPEWGAVRRVEALNASAISQRFGLTWTPEALAAVDQVDRDLVIDECLAVIVNGEEYLRLKGYDLTRRLGAPVAALAPRNAKAVFLLRWEELRRPPDLDRLHARWAAEVARSRR